MRWFKQAKIKMEIDWASREKQLLKLLDKHRRKDGEYDCLVLAVVERIVIYASHFKKIQIWNESINS